MSADLSLVLEQIIKISGKNNIAELKKLASESGIEVNKLTERVKNYNNATAKVNGTAISFATDAIIRAGEKQINFLNKLRNKRKRAETDEDYAAGLKLARKTDPSFGFVGRNEDGSIIKRQVARIFKKSHSATFNFAPDQDLSVLSGFLNSRDHELIQGENYLASKKQESKALVQTINNEREQLKNHQKLSKQDRKEERDEMKQDFAKKLAMLDDFNDQLDRMLKQQDDSYKLSAKNREEIANRNIKQLHKQMREERAAFYDGFDNDITDRLKKYDKALKDVDNVVKEQSKSAKAASKANNDMGFSFGAAIDGTLRLRHIVYGLGLAGAFYGGARAVQTFGRSITDAYRDSIMFNEEIKRSEIIFQNLGTQNTGLSAKQIREMGANDPRKASFMSQLSESGQFAKDLSAKMLELSAFTGQDYGQVVGAVSTMLPDLIDKLPGKNGENKLLKNKDMLVGLAEDYIKLGATLQSSDPMGHDLKWQLFAIQEMFAGTSGGKKDTGKESVASVRRRLGIKIKEDDALAIANAVNAGDVRKAMDLIIKRFEQAGQSVTKFHDMLAETLLPNLRTVQATMKIIGSTITQGSFQELVSFFSAMRIEMQLLREDPIFKNIFDKWGDKVQNMTHKVMRGFGGFIDSLTENNGEKLKRYGNSFLTTMDDLLDVMGALGTAGDQFLSGFLGKDESDLTFLQSIKNIIQEMNKDKTFFQLGEAARTMAGGLSTLSTTLTLLNPLLKDFAESVAWLKALGVAIGDISGTAFENTRLLANKTMDQGGGLLTDFSKPDTALRTLSNVMPKGYYVTVQGDMNVNGVQKPEDFRNGKAELKLGAGMNLNEWLKSKGNN